MTDTPARQLSWLGGSLLIAACQTVDPVPEVVLQDIHPGFNYITVFESATGYPVDSAYFAAYALQPIGDILYAGFGAGRPVRTNGALILATDADQATVSATLDEQGVYALGHVGNTLIIPGADPCCPDWWESGNFYTITASGTFTKHRNIPNVLHGFGVWYDAASGTVLMGTGSHRGDFASPLGEIWSTKDLGETWTREADHLNGAGIFRTYDIIGVDGTLFALNDRTFRHCWLAARTPVRKTWARVGSREGLSCPHRLTTHRDHVVAVDTTRTIMFRANGRGHLDSLALEFRVEREAVNWGVEVAGQLFVLREGGTIMRMQQPGEWDEVTGSSTSTPFAAIGYWPARDWLIVSELGAPGRLFAYPLCGGLPC